MTNPDVTNSLGFAVSHMFVLKCEKICETFKAPQMKRDSVCLGESEIRAKRGRVLMGISVANQDKLSKLLKRPRCSEPQLSRPKYRKLESTKKRDRLEDMFQECVLEKKSKPETLADPSLSSETEPIAEQVPHAVEHDQEFDYDPEQFMRLIGELTQVMPYAESYLVKSTNQKFHEFAMCGVNPALVPLVDSYALQLSQASRKMTKIADWSARMLAALNANLDSTLEVQHLFTTEPLYREEVLV
jgi:hypothetical protein